MSAREIVAVKPWPALPDKAAGVILYGGGLDSTALVLWLAQAPRTEKIVLLHADYGQKAAPRERQAARYWADKYRMEVRPVCLDLRDIAHSAILDHGNRTPVASEKNVLEGRNAILGMLAATYAATIAVPHVYFGYHWEPESAPFPDATHQGLVGMGHAMATCYRHPVRPYAPFQDWTREEIARTAYAADPDFFRATHTCYEVAEGGCGKCVHCRQKALIQEAVLSGRPLRLPLPENA